jgi:sulfonate transport system permease protein
MSLGGLVSSLGRPQLRRGLVLPALLALGWWISGRLHLVNEHLLVPPGKVFAEGRRFVAEGGLWPNLGASLARDFVGLAIGTVAGLVVGAGLGLSRRFNRVVGPSLHAVKQVAIFAWIPLISVWFGFGEPAKLVFIAMAAFYPVVLNSCQGVRGVATEHVEVARVLRFTRWQLLRRVILPSATPDIFAGLHLALIYSWVATIGAEYFLMAGPGIGHLMIDGREQFRMDLVLLGLVFSGAVGFALNTLAGRVEAHFVRWRRVGI